MKKHYLLGCVCAMALTAGSAFAAGEDEAYYLGVHGGLNFAKDTEFNDSGATGVNVDHDTGSVWGVHTGYDFDPIRIELEFSHRDDDVDDIVGSIAGVGDVSSSGSDNGDVNVDSLMLNGIYDFASQSKISPFVGAGLGIAWLDFNNVGRAGTQIADAKDSDFAWQGIAGLRADISEAVEATLSYRYFDTGGINVPLIGGPSIKEDYRAHSLMLGLTVRFGFGDEPRTPEPEYSPPPPPPPAPPAPEPAPEPDPEPVYVPEVIPGPFIVFFDWDSSELTDAAKTVIEEAAEAYAEHGLARIETIGHADRSGPDSYNVRLSERRGNAVKAALAGHGVGDDAVSMEAKGESDPLISTDDGVREPQNRRVEIILYE